MSAAPPPVEPSPGELALTLFIAGDSPASRRARTRLAELLDAAGLCLAPRIVDVLLAPQEAMLHRVFVTPALMVWRDGRADTVIGDLSHTENVLPLLRPRED